MGDGSRVKHEPTILRDGILAFLMPGGCQSKGTRRGPTLRQKQNPPPDFLSHRQRARYDLMMRNLASLADVLYQRTQSPMRRRRHARVGRGGACRACDAFSGSSQFFPVSRKRAVFITERHSGCQSSANPGSVSD
jgi:hypothetical protein